MENPVTQEKHVLNNAVSCPVCGSDDIQGDSYDFDSKDAILRQEMSCLTCDSEWYDVYRLSGYELTRNTKE